MTLEIITKHRMGSFATLKRKLLMVKLCMSLSLAYGTEVMRTTSAGGLLYNGNNLQTSASRVTVAAEVMSPPSSG